MRLVREYLTSSANSDTRTFALPPSFIKCHVGMMVGVPAAVLDHEANLNKEAVYKRSWNRSME